METARIADLLAPFLTGPLSEEQLRRLSVYLELLLRWNARMNLTAVRDPEHIVTRHFGESLFAATVLFPHNSDGTNHSADAAAGANSAESTHVVDIGSGAGFPGIPLKIWAPRVRLTLIESNYKKVAFLREVGRATTLTNIDVFAGLAQDFPTRASVVTLRAVEHFETILPIAAALVAPGARLALLVGSAQIQAASSLREFEWSNPIRMPHSTTRVLLLGARATEPKT